MRKTNLFIFDTNTLVSAFLVGSFSNNDAFKKALEIGMVITSRNIKKELNDVFYVKNLINTFHLMNE